MPALGPARGVLTCNALGPQKPELVVGGCTDERRQRLFVTPGAFLLWLLRMSSLAAQHPEEGHLLLPLRSLLSPTASAWLD